MLSINDLYNGYYKQLTMLVMFIQYRFLITENEDKIDAEFISNYNV